MKDEKIIKALRQFFKISVAAFEMQNTIVSAFGKEVVKSEMQLLNEKAKEEIEKDNPNLKLMDFYLAQMENLAENNSKS